MVILIPSDTEEGGKNADSIAIVHMPEACWFNLADHDSGCLEGGAFFYCVAGSKVRKQHLESEKICLWVDSGSGESLNFVSDCGGGRLVRMAFHRPFPMPTPILVAVNDRSVRGRNAAALERMKRSQSRVSHRRTARPGASTFRPDPAGPPLVGPNDASYG